MEISEKLKNDLLMNRRMLSIKAMAEQTKVNRWTLTDVLNGKRTSVKPMTYNRLENWLKEETK
ncbi:hypothetical protein NVV76_00995 [Pediococcus ethanolidurans]|uniref:hypothetical protein n=1 Tax=Pediococcus ethanolidurans TaxID=319653 RepID=UPI0021E7EA7E|nr:hypothetical protein [Pediococcus ethanolidurans]MCV3326748.1 hypothetical protein [Pediococcus ethanolidurans]